MQSDQFTNTVNAIRIEAVRNKQGLKKFILFPYNLYRHNKSWVPPLLITQKALLNEKHLFWLQNPHRFFLAFKNEKCVGRIAAFINLKHNDYHQSEEAFFGFIEATDDAAVFRSLLGAAESFAREYHCHTISGPFNPSIHYELGILTDGFEQPPYFMLTHHFDYYALHLSTAGYMRLKDFFSYKLESRGFIATSKMTRVKAYLEKRHGIKIREANLEKYNEELEVLFVIYNDAFAGHWGFTPIEKNEFKLLASDLKTVIDRKLVLIAELHEEAVAFLLCLPNYNEVFKEIKNGRLFPSGIFKLMAGKNKIKSVRVITVAVKKKYQHLGIGAALYPEILERAVKGKYTEGELSWVVDDNYEMNQVAKSLNASPYKTYSIYSKKL